MAIESVLLWPGRGASSVGVLGELERGDSLKGGRWGTWRSAALLSIGLVTGEELPESEPVVAPVKKDQHII